MEEATSIVRILDEKLRLKREELAALEAQHAELISELALLEEELRAFELLYRARLGELLQRLAEVEADLQEAFASIRPDDQRLKNRAAQARKRAEECKREVDCEPLISNKAPKSDQLKELFKAAAKKIHPDLTTDDAERELRTEIMAKVNAAFTCGDEEELRKILHEWELRPESIKGQGTNFDIARTERQIRILKSSIVEVRNRIDDLKSSSLGVLKTEADASGDVDSFFLILEKKIVEKIQRSEIKLDQIRKAIDD